MGKGWHTRACTATLCLCPDKPHDLDERVPSSNQHLGFYLYKMGITMTSFTAVLRRLIFKLCF